MTKVTQGGETNGAYETNQNDPSEQQNRKISNTSSVSEPKQTSLAPVHSLLNRFRRSKSCCNDNLALKLTAAPKEESKISDLWKLGNVFSRSVSDGSFDSLPADNSVVEKNSSCVPEVDYNPSCSQENFEVTRDITNAQHSDKLVKKSRTKAISIDPKINEEKGNDGVSSQLQDFGSKIAIEDAISIPNEEESESTVSSLPSESVGSHQFISLPITAPVFEHSYYDIGEEYDDCLNSRLRRPSVHHVIFDMDGPGTEDEDIAEDGTSAGNLDSRSSPAINTSFSEPVSQQIPTSATSVSLGVTAESFSTDANSKPNESSSGNAIQVSVSDSGLEYNTKYAAEN